MRNKAIELKESCIEDKKERDNFVASKTFIKNFMRRNNLSYRKRTHVSQHKKIDISAQCMALVSYLKRLRFFLAEFPLLDLILNCDETPCWFDMVGKMTIDVKGTRSIDLITTGHDKTRFTVLLTIAANGYCLPAYVVFRGLKKVPNCAVPENVIVNVNESGSMDRRLMVDYLRQVVFRYLQGRSGALVMDSFRAHFVDEVVEYMEDINLKAKAITPGYTSDLQPLDVVINKPFKNYMEDEWKVFISEPTTEADFTKGGNRKKPSYERILNMVGNSVKRLNDNPEMIKKVRIVKDFASYFLSKILYFKAFTVCGFIYNNDKYKSLSHLNYSLRAKLGIDLDWDREQDIMDEIHDSRFDGRF